MFVRRLLKLTTAVALCFSSVLLAAGENAPIVDKYGQRGLFYTHSAKTLGMGRLSVGAYGNYTGDKEYMISAEKIGDTSWAGSYVPSGVNVADINVSLAYGITRYLDLAVMLPLYLDWVTSHGAGADKFGGTIAGGAGDLEVSLKWQYPPYPHRKFFEMAYYGAVSVPTGNASKKHYFPRHAYYELKDVDSGEVKYFYTSKGVEVDMKMLWTFDFNQLKDGAPVEFHINYGVRWTPYYLDHLFLLNSGLSYTPAPWVSLFADFSGETRIANIDRGFKLGDDPLRLSPGITFTPPGGLFITLGADIGLTSTDSAVDMHYTVNDKFRVQSHIEPRWKLVGMIGWAGFVMPQDKDKDGIKDNEDRCPAQPEDYDGFQDNDGCPEFDNDADGVPDSSDKCPNEAEDLDGFDDADGCPEYDNDGDGVRDSVDKCPNEAEDLDGFEDADGCPEYDNDGDGIVDSLDHCINTPEDKDGFEDNDGCPELDNDNDGVPDSTDRCPDKPEVFNAYEDEDGCPDEKPVEAPKPKAKEIKRGRVILRGVNFESGRAVLTPESYAILDQVYASLVEWPEVKLEISGHTDSVGSRSSNKRLSYARAQAVRQYLIDQGIAPERLIAIGMGEDQPIADNTTASGRAMNRRVEMHRID